MFTIIPIIEKSIILSSSFNLAFVLDHQIIIFYLSLRELNTFLSDALKLYGHVGGRGASPLEISCFSSERTLIQ